MAFVEQVNVEGFSGPELQHILTNTPQRSKLIFNSKYFKRLHIYKQFLLARTKIFVQASCGQRAGAH